MDFECVVEWSGDYPGQMTCQNGMNVVYSPPVEFGGSSGTMSPEDAFVGSANMCFQIVFAGIAHSLEIEVLRYRSRAVGKLEVVDGARKFVRIDIEAEVKLGAQCEEARLQKAVEATKRKCPVTNSMDTEVFVNVTTV